MRIALIDRRYCLRLALVKNDPNDREDRDALSMFGASLPPPRSRLLIVLRLFAVIAVSQVLLALLLRSQEDVARSRGKATAEHVIAQLATVAELNPGTFHRDRQRAAAQQSDGALNLWVKGTLAHATPA